MRLLLVYLMGWTLLTIGFFSLVNKIGMPELLVKFRMVHVEMTTGAAICFIITGIAFLLMHER